MTSKLAPKTSPTLLNSEELSNNRSWWHTLSHTVNGFISHDCQTLAASLAFYTLFALPPLLFLLVAIVSAGMSAFLGSEDASVKAQEFLQLQASNLIGNQAAATEIGNIMEMSRNQEGTWWKSLLSVAGVFVAATGLVSALQSSLNRVWAVKPVDTAFAFSFLWKRLLSLATILCFGFLLIVSFGLSTLLATVGTFISSHFGLEGMVPVLVNQTISLFTSWGFFTAIFRFMPDAHVRWRHAWLGGLLTVLLFTLGRTALFYYLSFADPAAHLGSAASSLVVILLWVYYSSSILLLGAEYTASLAGTKAIPVPGAARVKEKTTMVNHGQADPNMVDGAADGSGLAQPRFANDQE